MAATPTWSLDLSYGAILVLLGAQVWDLWLNRRCVCRAASIPTDSALRFPETRKEGVPAPNWWRCADRDGLSRLSLLPDCNPSASGCVVRRNGSGDFSDAVDRTAVHIYKHLLCGGTRARSLALVRSGENAHPRSTRLSDLSASTGRRTIPMAIRTSRGTASCKESQDTMTFTQEYYD